MHKYLLIFVCLRCSKLKKAIVALYMCVSMLCMGPDFLYAGVDLPWSTTFNCAEWTSYSDPLDCDGIGKGGSWACSSLYYEGLIAAANFSSGGGGKGMRHYIGDGTNINSGGFIIDLNITETELWIRWYKKYPTGFVWSDLADEKWLWITTASGAPARIAGWQNNYVRFWNQATSPEIVYGTANMGWDHTMGNSPANGLSSADGQWHCYEVHIKLQSSPTAYDGKEDVWIDGTSVLSATNVNHGVSTTGWNRLVFGINQKYPNNGGCLGVDIDDIAISNTGYIGPLGCEDAEDCDDLNVCTTDTCPSGTCVYENNTEACEDGLYCTINDTCATGTCSDTDARDCADADACTTDTCNETTNACDHTYGAATVDIQSTDLVMTETGPNNGSVVIDCDETAGTVGCCTGLDIPYTLGGTGTLTNDYTVSDATPITITNAAIPSTNTFTTVDDGTYEGGSGTYETILFDLTTNSKYTISGTDIATLNIEDNENTPAFNAPVFGGCEGYGCLTTGGRQAGAQLCVVNSTDAGNTGYCGAGGSPVLPTNVCHGTLEWCAEQGTAARMVIFSTGGRIDLDSNIDIVDQYVTVFGQTAPGSGVVVSSDDDGTGDDTLKIRTSDVLIQGMRFRTDDYNYTTSACETTRENTLDASDAAGALNNIVIDRCSLSWSCNEILNLGWYTGNTNFTVSNSILSEGFYLDSADKFGLAVNSGDIVGFSFHHNLIAHNASRNPKFGAYTGTDDALHTMNHIDNIECVNNVIYDWFYSGPSLWTNQEFIGEAREQDADFIGNYFKKGTETTAGAHEFLFEEDLGHLASTTDIFLSGNVSDQHDCVTDSWANCVDGDVSPYTTMSAVRTQTGSGMNVSQSAADAYTQVLLFSGAQSTLNPRDAVDAQIVQDVSSGTGEQIDNATGLWPTYSAGTAPTDTDYDGLPDAYEASIGTNPAVADSDSDGTFDWMEDTDADGYWNIEDYATGLLEFSGVPGGCTIGAGGTGGMTFGSGGTGRMDLFYPTVE